MSKGVIYVMTTVVPGLIKIGKTQQGNFENRMNSLERNGYSNVVGLKRCFAIEVDDYDEKEILIDDIFSKSRLEKTELFALDVNLVVQLLSSFDGKQIYPKDVSRDEVFEEASESRGISMIPNGIYYLKRKIKLWDNNICTASMSVDCGNFIVQKGAVLCPIEGNGKDTARFVRERRRKAKIIDGILQSDETFSSPSMAAAFVIYGPANGWTNWKTEDGTKIDYFRRGVGVK